MYTREIIYKICSKWLEKNLTLAEFLNNRMSEEEIAGVITSIICTRDGISYPGGSFVQAICDNDLDAAVSRADLDNIKLLKLYVIAKNCIPSNY